MMGFFNTEPKVEHVLVHAPVITSEDEKHLAEFRKSPHWKSFVKALDWMIAQNLVNLQAHAGASDDVILRETQQHKGMVDLKRAFGIYINKITPKEE